MPEQFCGPIQPTARLFSVLPSKKCDGNLQRSAAHDLFQDRWIWPSLNSHRFPCFLRRNTKEPSKPTKEGKVLPSYIDIFGLWGLIRTYRRPRMDEMQRRTSKKSLGLTS